MSTQRQSQLAIARHDKLLVKFTRPCEKGSVNGYVLDIGSRFFLMAVLGSDGVRLNGFSCFRLSDVRKLKAPHKYAAFVAAAREKLGERTPRRPAVAVGSIHEILRSANRSFPLVTVHREQVDPDVCHIGRVICWV